MSKQDLIILFGGESRERWVSVATGQNLSQALPEALCWFWASNDAVYQVSPTELAAHQDVFKSDFKPSSEALFETILDALDSEQAAASTFVLGVHGGRGEDGTLQRWLEERKIAFTGSGSTACDLCMHKEAAKNVVGERGVKIAPSAFISGLDIKMAEQELARLLAGHPKLILKPNSEGSSFGIYVITPDTVDIVREKLNAYPDRQYLLEAFIEGTELTVGVVDGPQGARALVPTELRAEGFADYDGKYLGLGTAEITPAEVSESITRAAQRVAVAAHEALGCEGYSRTDMMIDGENPIFLETNALPGLTKASLVPQALAFEGISIREFIVTQVELARARVSRSL